MIGAAVLALAASAASEPLRFESGNRRVDLLELYTSEGCSSCPPADAWLSKLVDDERLWREVVPVAFHVDYWDYLGWKDPFASAKNSDRQRRYAASWREGSVYTPGFVLNGEEWRGFFSRHGLPDVDGKSAGELSAHVDESNVTIDFAPSEDHGDLVVHVALLGFGIEQPISRGENAGRTLVHDFVALDHRTIDMEAGCKSVVTELRQPDGVNAERFAVAAWVTKRNTVTSLQAVGGWLSPNEP